MNKTDANFSFLFRCSLGFFYVPHVNIMQSVYGIFSMCQNSSLIFQKGDTMNTNAVVIGLFDYYNHADAAVKALEDYGVDSDHISVVTRDNDTIKSQQSDTSQQPDTAEGAATGAATGAVAGGLVGLLAGLSPLVIPGIGPIIATGTIAGLLTTTLGMTAVGAGIGAATGGLLGALVNLGFSPDEAEFYAEGVKRGGVLVSVETHAGEEHRVREILRGAGAVDMETRRQSWRNEGWTSFEETGEAERSDESTYRR
jgi:uncharacterized membrane protein